MVTPTLQLLHGEDPVEIRTPPVVQVALDLAVPFDTVFDPRGILMNLAFVLGIDIRTIRLVNVIAEDSNMRRKRQAVEGGTNDTMVVIEIGNLPENISTPDVVAVSDQVAKYSNDSVDLGAGAQVSEGGRDLWVPQSEIQVLGVGRRGGLGGGWGGRISIRDACITENGDLSTFYSGSQSVSGCTLFFPCAG